MKNLFLCLIFLLSSVQASDLRLKSMGEMKYAVPDQDIKLNLFSTAGNTAWLKENDSLNWGKYSLNTLNDWGSLHRFWDAEGVHSNYFLFQGLKHITEYSAFFGSVKYNNDYHTDVNQAIDPRPYDNDPFVLADSTKGRFNYYGPSIVVGYSHRLFTNLYLGLLIDYSIGQGLKSVNSRPEIISRYVTGGIEAAYKFSEQITIGLSYRPFSYKDITKIERQPEGTYPVTRRYRGEFEFSQHVSTSDRTADYDGYELSPQISYKYSNIEGITFAGYKYLWQKVFDGTSTQHIDGNYQSEAFSFTNISRYYFDAVKQSSLTLHYNFNYLEDWAREPVAKSLIYQAWYREHHISAGFTHQLSSRPLMVSGEFVYDYYDPQKNDYLAHLNRQGKNTNLELHLGTELKAGSAWRFRMGYVFQDYQESSIWNYFDNYSGHSLTGGLGFHKKTFEIDSYIRFGRLQHSEKTGFKRNILNFQVSLKQYF